MEITLLRGCVVNKDAHTRGDCFETDDAQGKLLIKQGAAIAGKDDSIKPLPPRVLQVDKAKAKK